MPTLEPANYTIRAYREEDRAAAGALGQPVIDWWSAHGPETFLHLVMTMAGTGELVGHLQARDCSLWLALPPNLVLQLELGEHATLIRCQDVGRSVVADLTAAGAPTLR